MCVKKLMISLVNRPYDPKNFINGEGNSISCSRHQRQQSAVGAPEEHVRITNGSFLFHFFLGPMITILKFSRHRVSCCKLFNYKTIRTRPKSSSSTGWETDIIGWNFCVVFPASWRTKSTFYKINPILSNIILLIHPKLFFLTKPVIYILNSASLMKFLWTLAI